MKNLKKGVFHTDIFKALVSVLSVTQSHFTEISWEVSGKLDKLGHIF